MHLDQKQRSQAKLAMLLYSYIVFDYATKQCKNQYDIIIGNVAVLVGVHAFVLEISAGINRPSYFMPTYKFENYNWIRAQSMDGKCPKIDNPPSSDLSTEKGDGCMNDCAKILQISLFFVLLYQTLNKV